MYQAGIALEKEDINNRGRYENQNGSSTMANNPIPGSFKPFLGLLSKLVRRLFTYLEFSQN